ncbi:TIR domain-containing protein [Pseudomonas fluorescens]|nr:TIR domain-containing protein [Pseudomonas fluorescens]NKI51433.1 TIR domain-containing protein [Pseudomonas fluorescens]NKI63926.1 TIR domain-containing protein [Pseudomonas fluorescens]
MKNPKVFISYSWSSEDHESWVVELAEQLMQAGVETILDKWDLQPGHNAYKFMEKMVNDSSIDKVLIICDELYTQKANAQGSTGVSTETQIISPVIYSNALQEKFVALVTQRDESGKPFLPTYYGSRMYIDFSNSAQQSEVFERLIRFIFGQPLYKRPELGKAPSYIAEPSLPSLGTTVAYNRAINLLKSGKSTAEGAVDEYLSLFVENLSRFEVSFIGLTDDQKVSLTSDNLASLLPYRNEITRLFSAIAQYSPSENLVHRIHRFFEKTIEYIFPKEGKHYSDWDFDNFKFLCREVFLCFVASLIKHERFERLGFFLSSTYFVRSESVIFRNTLCDHSIFSWHLNSLEFRNKHQKLGKTSLTATMLNERCEPSIVSFQEMMQADFILYLRAQINSAERLPTPGAPWHPDTAVYVGHHAEAFEIFIRASSIKYYERINPIFNNWSTGELSTMLKTLNTNGNLPKFGWDKLQVLSLSAADQLGTRP